MAKVKKSTGNKCWREHRGRGTLIHCWWYCELVQPLWRFVWGLLGKLEVDLVYDPIIPLIGTCPKDSLSYCRGACLLLLIAALFTVARERKQPMCLSTDE